MRVDCHTQSKQHFPSTEFDDFAAAMKKTI